MLIDRGKSVGVVLLSALLMSAGAPTALGVSAEPNETSVEVVEVPMQIVGYDEAIAEANGFRIIVDEHGTEQSVPVTDEARAIVDDYDWSVTAPSGGMSTMDIVIDDCGSSLRHVWAVSGATEAGTYYEPFNGWNASNTWNATHIVYVGSNSEGWGQVVAGSRAFLINGAICWSGQPFDELD